MRIGMTKTRWLVGIVAAMAMLGVLACGGADEPAPAAAALDTAAIQAAVKEAVTASAPETASAADIQKMVEAAVMARPGISKADLEASISKSAGQQLSSADVKRVVDAAIKALPVPKLDVAALTATIEKSVKASVPKGTSAAEIRTMVEAAVTAASADVATRGDMEAAVAKSVKEAAASQLTAAQVQKIVDASVKATEATVAEAVAAAEKTQAAGQTAFADAVAQLQEAKLVGAPRSPITDPARTDPSLLAKKSPNGLYSYRWTGPIPTKFNEAPMLAELVRAGKLPPVEQRLPDEPLVSPPTEAIGKYGGTWRKAYQGGGAMMQVVRSTRLVRYDGDGSYWAPNIVKKLEVTNGGRVATYTIRKGHKWSNGDLFTTKDISFVFDDLMHNIEYEKNGFPSYWADPITKSPPKLDVIDDFVWSFTWDNPAYGVHESTFAVGKSFNSTVYYPYAPSKYLMQFHRDLTKDKAGLDAMIKDAGLPAGIDDWPRFLKRIKGSYFNNPEVPTLAAWMTVDGLDGPEWITERNPYYHVVDPAGNQLPYIDRIHLTRISDAEVVALKAAAGELDWQGRNISIDKLPLLRKFADQNGYFIYLSKSSAPTDAVINISQTYALTDADLAKGADKLIGDLLRTRDFRIGLSLGLDRDALNESYFFGTGVPRAWTTPKGHPEYVGDEYANLNIQHDVKKANQLLDAIVLPGGGKIDKMSSDGKWRLRPDNGEPLKLRFEIYNRLIDYGPLAEVINRKWEELGIQGTYKQDGASLGRISNGEGYLFIWTPVGGKTGLNTWSIPKNNGYRSAPYVGDWYNSGGEKGVPPDHPAFKNEGGVTEFPFVKLLDLWEQGAAYSLIDPKHAQIAQEVFRIHIQEMLHIATVAGTAAFKGTIVVNKDMHNVSTEVEGQEWFGSNHPRPETLFYEHPELHTIPQ